MRKPEPAISRVLSSTTIHLGQSSPTASSNLPGSPLGTGGAPKRYSPIWSCSRRGLPCRELLPVARCALTAPFHPYRQAGGIFSVALSMGSRPPGVTWRLVRRSPDFPLQGRGTCSDRLANSGFLGYRFYSKKSAVGARNAREALQHLAAKRLARRASSRAARPGQLQQPLIKRVPLFAGNAGDDLGDFLARQQVR